MIGKPLRILHLTVQRALSSGQRKQLRYEAKASKALSGVEWDTLAVHEGTREDAFERPIPAPFRYLVLRWLYGWIITKRLARQYDFVLLRHMTFDPFALVFAPLIRNRISVHHSKEIEEMPLISPGIKGRVAAAVERFAGAVAVSESCGILGVTRELAQYERDLRAPGKPSFYYPNGIDPDSVALIDDDRSNDESNVVFICGKFSEWHGLDRLIEAVSSASDVPEKLRVHLIGRMSDRQRWMVAELGQRAQIFEIHGSLQSEAYRELLSCADLGIGSLAMDRQNLNEGATLKVRELLAAGIPMISGHWDTALPPEFPFYRVRQPISVDALVSFAREMKLVTRSEVRKAALPLIDKGAAMCAVADWLREEFVNAR